MKLVKTLAPIALIIAITLIFIIFFYSDKYIKNDAIKTYSIVILTSLITAIIQYMWSTHNDFSEARVQLYILFKRAVILYGMLEECLKRLQQMNVQDERSIARIQHNDTVFEYFKNWQAEEYKYYSAIKTHPYMPDKLKDILVNILILYTTELANVVRQIHEFNESVLNFSTYLSKIDQSEISPTQKSMIYFEKQEVHSALHTAKEQAERAQKELNKWLVNLQDIYVKYFNLKLPKNRSEGIDDIIQNSLNEYFKSTEKCH